MSLHPHPVPPIPEDTARIARAAFPRGNIYMVLRDEIGILLTDEDFVALFPKRGQPAETPWRLALVTIFQFIEGLSDRAAADAVRSRIDWKYALRREVENPFISCLSSLLHLSRFVDSSCIIITPANVVYGFYLLPLNWIRYH